MMFPFDETDLRNFRASELKIGGYFYLKQEDGFHLCRITQEDLIDPLKKWWLSRETNKYSKEGKLFVRISNPWQPFSK